MLSANLAGFGPAVWIIGNRPRNASVKPMKPYKRRIDRLWPGFNSRSGSFFFPSLKQREMHARRSVFNCATPRTAQFFMLRGPCTGSLENWAHVWKYLKKLGVQSFKTSVGSKRNFVTAPRTSHLISNVKRIKCTFFLFSGHVLGVAIVAQFSLVCYFRFRRKRNTLGFIWA